MNTMKNDLATPRPWQIQNTLESTIIANIDGPDGGHTDFHYDVICELNTDGVDYDANAELIVRAVNNFDALLDASQSAYAVLSTLRLILKPEDWDIVEPIKEKLENAIANAEK